MTLIVVSIVKSPGPARGTVRNLELDVPAGTCTGLLLIETLGDPPWKHNIEDYLESKKDSLIFAESRGGGGGGGINSYQLDTIGYRPS